MDNFKHPFLQELAARGLYQQCSNIAGLESYLADKDATAYIGFDCTAPSLHIGNLLAIMALRRFQQAGFRVVIVMGGGTTRIGDPSGKDKSREILSPEKIEQNINSIRSVFSKFLDLDRVQILNNYDWLKDLNYIDFLRDVGKHFSVNRMLTMDSVQLRLEREQPLSFLEFNYMIVQAFDFAHLAQTYNCRLQMGGSDQWGNIVNGVELARRQGLGELFALTMPLITTQDGNKMGKTAEGAVWLNDDPAHPEHSLSPYLYWQFWRNTRDDDVARFLRIFTDLPLSEIKKLEQLKDEDINEAKKVLANEATALAHGRKAADEAALAAKLGFEKGAGAGAGTGGSGGGAMPSALINKTQLEKGLGLLEAYVATGLAASNSEARRYIRAGAAKVNNEIVKDEKMRLDITHAKDGIIKLAIGKKNLALLKIKN